MYIVIKEVLLACDTFDHSQFLALNKVCGAFFVFRVTDMFNPASLVQWLAASPCTAATLVQSPGSAYRQFGFMPEMEVHTCYNSQKVTAASV